jgi:hypothetical protein
MLRTGCADFIKARDAMNIPMRSRIYGSKSIPVKDVNYCFAKMEETIYRGVYLQIPTKNKNIIVSAIYCLFKWVMLGYSP